VALPVRNFLTRYYIKLVPCQIQSHIGTEQQFEGRVPEVLQEKDHLVQKVQSGDYCTGN
jgi:hypothetical protein